MIKFSHILIEKSPFLTSFSCTVCWWAGVPVVVLVSVQQLGSLRSSVASSFRLLPNECKVQKKPECKVLTGTLLVMTLRSVQLRLLQKSLGDGECSFKWWREGHCIYKLSTLDSWLRVALPAACLEYAGRQARCCAADDTSPTSSWMSHQEMKKKKLILSIKGWGAFVVTQSSASFVLSKPECARLRKTWETLTQCIWAEPQFFHVN